MTNLRARRKCDMDRTMKSVTDSVKSSRQRAKDKRVNILAATP